MLLSADDMALYSTIKSPVDYWKLQLDITALADWIDQNDLSFQPPKRCYMLITRKGSLSLPTPTICFRN